MASGRESIPTTGYGSIGQSGDALYTPPPTQDSSEWAPPPPIVSSGFNLDDPYGSTTPKKRGRKLWIILGVIGGVLVISVVLRNYSGPPERDWKEKE